MREIKFHFWNVNEKEMMKDASTFTDDYTDMLNETFKMWQDPELSEPLIPMQYTGLKDKNGKEIYEGDILLVVEKTAVEEIEGHIRYEDEGLLAEIIFDSGSFAMKGDNSLDSEALWEYSIYGEVIGNIYENPDLLSTLQE